MEKKIVEISSSVSGEFLEAIAVIHFNPAGDAQHHKNCVTTAEVHVVNNLLMPALNSRS